MLTFVYRLVAVSGFVLLCCFLSPPPVYRVVVEVVGESGDQHGGLRVTDSTDLTFPFV